MIDYDIKLCANGYEAYISSLLGATCFRLSYSPWQAEILHYPKDIAERNEAVFLYGNPILFPPNRIRDGEFVFEGRLYRFPVNEPQNGCHIHGALFNLPFSVYQQTENSVELVYRAKEGEYLGFPNAFEVRRKYTLGANGLKEETVIENLSDFNLPWMLAFHTSFQLPFLKDTKATDCELFVRTVREHIRDEHFMPTKEYRTDDPVQQKLNVGKYVLSEKPLSAFYLSEGESEIRIREIKSGKSIVYRSGKEYGYRMLFQNKAGDFVVVEPQTCAIDCFHIDTPYDKNGLIVIEPHQKRTFVTEIGVQE